MEFLNVSRQRAAEPSATGRALSKAAGFVTEGAGDTAAAALVGSAASPGASSTAGAVPAVFYPSALQLGICSHMVCMETCRCSCRPSGPDSHVPKRAVYRLGVICKTI